MPHATKEARRQYHREWAARNRDKIRGYTRKHAHKRRDYQKEHSRKRLAILDGFKAAEGCVRCSVKDPRVLDFHHRNAEEKKYEIGRSGRRQKWPVLFAELCKCDVLCKNCHAITHWEMKENAT